MALVLMSTVRAQRRVWLIDLYTQVVLITLRATYARVALPSTRATLKCYMQLPKLLTGPVAQHAGAGAVEVGRLTLAECRATTLPPT